MPDAARCTLAKGRRLSVFAKQSRIFRVRRYTTRAGITISLLNSPIRILYLFHFFFLVIEDKVRFKEVCDGCDTIGTDSNGIAIRRRRPSFGRSSSRNQDEDSDFTIASWKRHECRYGKLKIEKSSSCYIEKFIYSDDLIKPLNIPINFKWVRAHIALIPIMKFMRFRLLTVRMSSDKRRGFLFLNPWWNRF